MNHLERLIRQYYEWQGYVVATNVNVGRRRNGGYECELDVVAYHAQTDHLLHIEPSLDAHSWAKRELRFTRKFQAGAKYVKTEVFPWLPPKTSINHVAIIVGSAEARAALGGGKVVNLDAFMAEVKAKIRKRGLMATNAIPEQYDLLRTIQLAICGYRRLIPVEGETDETGALQSRRSRARRSHTTAATSQAVRSNTIPPE